MIEGMGVIRGDFAQGNLRGVIERGVDSLLRHLEGVKGRSREIRSIWRFTSAIGKPVLAGMVENEKDLFFSDDFPEVLVGKRSVFEFEPFEDEQAAAADPEGFPSNGGGSGNRDP